MNSKTFIKHIFLLLTILATFSTESTFGQDTSRSVVKELLPVPFGTVVKMKIQIVDGEEELNTSKCHSDYLFRVISVNGILLSKPVAIEFKETNVFPSNVFSLYKFLYGRDTGILNSNIIRKMNKEYVGKELEIDGYETGEFLGIPNVLSAPYGTQCGGFRFRHRIIVANITKTVIE